LVLHVSIIKKCTRAEEFHHANASLAERGGAREPNTGLAWKVFCRPQSRGSQVKLIKRILLGIVVLSTTQVMAKAEDDAATEIRLLKEKLKNSSSASMRRAGRKPTRGEN
jgi:hypothetical protein